MMTALWGAANSATIARCCWSARFARSFRSALLLLARCFGDGESPQPTSAMARNATRMCRVPRGCGWPCGRGRSSA